jgi:peptidoglycan/LPS O-acetylase OafA/YrhL
VLGIASAAALSAAAFAIDRRTGVATNYLGTLVYVFPFVVGALVALHLDDVRARLVTTSTPVKAAFVLGAVLMYKPAYLQPIGVLQWGPVNDWLTALATAVLLVAAVESMRFATVLRLRPLRWLGAVSYSLYLLHSIVFLIAVGVLGGQLPNVVVIGLAVVLSLPVAALGHRYLETPARSLGRRLAAAGQVHEGRRTKH